MLTFTRHNDYYTTSGLYAICRVKVDGGWIFEECNGADRLGDCRGGNATTRYEEAIALCVNHQTQQERTP